MTTTRRRKSFDIAVEREAKASGRSLHLLDAEITGAPAYQFEGHTVGGGGVEASYHHLIIAVGISAGGRRRGIYPWRTRAFTAMGIW